MSVYSPAGCHSRAGRISVSVSIGAPTIVGVLSPDPPTPPATGGSGLSAAEVAEAAAIKARQLAGLGVGAGDRVAVALPPGLEFAALLHAMPLLGSVLVPVNTRDPHFSVDAGFLVDAPLTGPEADVSPRGEPSPDDVWVILHPSG